MSLRDANGGRRFNHGITRPTLVLWCEPELLVVIFIFACAICCPMSLQPRYDFIALGWCVLATPFAQWLARYDPRFMRKWRAHRRWKGPGSAILPYIIDESTSVSRAVQMMLAIYHLVNGARRRSSRLAFASGKRS